MERNLVKGKVIMVHSKTRHAKFYLPFLIENSEYFTCAVALYLFVKIERGNDAKKLPVGFDIRIVAETLKFDLQALQKGYKDCVARGWFKEVTKEVYWRVVFVKD